jgi:hypothetical protein
VHALRDAKQVDVSAGIREILESARKGCACRKSGERFDPLAGVVQVGGPRARRGSTCATASRCSVSSRST